MNKAYHVLTSQNKSSGLEWEAHQTQSHGVPVFRASVGLDNHIHEALISFA